MPEANQSLEPVKPALSRAEQTRQVPFVWRWFSYLVLYPLIGVATAFFGSIAMVVGLWDKSGRQQHTLARVWAWVLLRIAFCPVTVEHAERLKIEGPAVYACNHLSYYDTPALFAKLPFQFRIIAKAPLWKIPFVGWYLQHSGQVPIDQSSRGCGEPAARCSDAEERAATDGISGGRPRRGWTVAGNGCWCGFYCYQGAGAVGAADADWDL